MMYAAIMERCLFFLNTAIMIKQQDDLFISCALKGLTNKKKKNKGMACHTPPLDKAKKQGSHPIPKFYTLK